MISIIIPARNEIFLQKTIYNILENATGEIEILVGLDGYWPQPALKDDKRVVLYHTSVSKGMRETINSLARVAKGEYLLKCDAHCAFAKGFDEILKKDCDKDWIVIPRRYSLDPKTWGIENENKVRDAHFLSYPTAFMDTLGFGMHVKDWFERGKARKDFLIDDEMISQGSCWFMHKDYYKVKDTNAYGPWGQESQEMMLTTWLSGGRVVINKNTWYAHLWKGRRFGRMYELDRRRVKETHAYSANFWYHSSNLIHPFEWIIDKFWPVPTWPDDWKTLSIEFPKTKEIIMKTIDIPKIETSAAPVIQVKENLPIISTNEYLMKKFNVTENSKMPVGIPNYDRKAMAKLFNELGYKVGAEIGVRSGEFTEIMFVNNPGVKIYGIDAWEVYKDYGDFDPKEIEKFYNQAKKRLSKYNCELIKKYSLDAVKDFDDNSLDFIFIDANHRFEYVIADIAAWSKKVRPGGIISGHDYKVFWNYNSTSHIYEAINGYTRAYRIKPWYIFRTRLVDKSRFNLPGTFMWVKQ